MPLIAELKRRNVFKVGAAYLALGWIVTQVTTTVGPVLNLPATLTPIVVWIGVIGLPFVVLFSWVYELTPEGLKRESEIDRSASITHVTSRKLDYLIVGLLVAAIAIALLDRLVPRGTIDTVGAGHARDKELTAGTGTTEESRAQGALPQPPASPVQATPDDKSIAVLPFVNLSSDKEQDYFSDGLSEELLNLLAKIPALQVTSRSSAFSYKGKEIRMSEVARELNVAHILEGSVRKSGDRIRITAQLIDARTDKHLWSETYDRKLDDIFAVQDEIAGAVVGQLKLKLLGEAPKATVVNPVAYALFLQARQWRRQGSAEAVEQSIAALRKALALDAGYAVAWDELGRCYRAQAALGVRPREEAYSLAREAVDKALALDPGYARAHDALGWTAMMYDVDLPAAARHYQRALAQDPANADIIGNASNVARALGRLDTAIAMNEWSIVRDPISASLHSSLAFKYYTVGRLGDAVASYRTSLALSPGQSGTHGFLGRVLLQSGEPQAALAEVEQEGDESMRLYVLALVQHALGHNTESDAALADLNRKYDKEWPGSIAAVYAFRGEADQAFEWLDRTIAAHDETLAGIVADPDFVKLHDDPRWLPYLHRIGMAPEQLAAIQFDVKLP